MKQQKLRTLEFNLKSTKRKNLEKVMQKYGRLSEIEKREMATEIGYEIVMEEIRDRLSEGETCLVKILDDKQVVMKQKIKKINGKLLIDFDTMVDSLEVEPEEAGEILAALEDNRRLAPNEWFVHPLAEICEEKPDFVNMYAFATMLINGIRNVDGQLDGDPVKCEEALKHFLIKINPLLNINRSIAQIKMHDLSEIMKVCNAIGTVDMTKFVNDYS